MFFAQDFSEKDLATFLIVTTKLRFFKEMNLRNKALKIVVSF
jgi:hypothetical protein